MISAGVILIVIGSIMGEWSILKISNVSEKSMFSLFYLIVFGSIITFGAYLYLLRHSTIDVVSTITNIKPVFALFVGWMIGKEELNLRIIIGGSIIILSVITVIYNRERKGLTTNERISSVEFPIVVGSEIIKEK